MGGTTGLVFKRSAIPPRGGAYPAVRMNAMRSFSRGFLILCAMSLPLPAAFVPPAEGPVPFRRDKLPVDVETMTSLSRQVTVLAAAEPGETAEQRRAVAQMAALALALDPANRQARDLIEAAEKGEQAGTPDEKELEEARNRAWQTLSWLEMPEAGADGNALAACLGDVLTLADPGHPKAKAHSGEQGAWKDWVAAKDAFQTEEAVKPVEPAVPDGGAPAQPEAALALTDLELPMPLWVQDRETNAVSLQPVKVSFHATMTEEGTKFEVAGDGLTERFEKEMRLVDAALKARHGTLPKGLHVNLSFGKAGYSVTRNGHALTGTAALLLDGARAGKVPAAMTLAVVGEGGKLRLPPKFWATLRALVAMPGGGRLILPKEAAEYLPALLTMDEAAFFMKREVLLAGTVDELCELAKAQPEEKVGEALKRFAEIRKVGEGKPLGTFVAHPATQQRLKEVTDGMPEHASARLLGLQGGGSRPRSLPRSILAREIRTALEPAATLMDLAPQDIKSPDLRALEKAHEASRAGLDKLTGYIDIRDRDLHKSAVEVADSLRTLARLLGKEDDEFKTVGPKQTSATRAARDAYLRVMRDLTSAAGDEIDYPLPAKGPGPGN